MQNFIAISAKGERYTFNAESMPLALDWIVNHLDCSEEWFLGPLETPPYMILKGHPDQPIGHAFIHKFEYSLDNPLDFPDELVSLYIGPEDEDYAESWEAVKEGVRITIEGQHYAICESLAGDLWAFAVE